MQIRLLFRLVWLLTGLAFAVVACTQTGPTAPTENGVTAEFPVATAAPPTTVNAGITAVPEVIQSPALLPAEDPPASAAREFRTDFSVHTIPYSEILSGGPPKDGIPAIDEPQFVSITAADAWLDDLEPVTVFQEQDTVRVYPFQILMWHEIVNDVVNGRPIVVTFCPLCNTAIVFDATVNGQPLDFGTTGRLRFSNLLMYDRQTESWWQQASGEAVIGELTGTQLAFLPANIISWAEARARYPEAQVLSRETGYSRSYGQNPYSGYDNINSSPFLFSGDTPDQLPAMARVITVELNDEAVAYPNDLLQEVGVINDTVGGVDIAIFWQAGLASALDDSDIAAGEDVGANSAFARELNGRTLTFAKNGTTFKDEQTGSTWNILGEATAGGLAGAVLTPVVKVDHFWFSWAAFRPDTRIYQQP
jgi:hypothetical protein